MSFKVEPITEPLTLGEGPHWDIPSQTLYFVDIYKGSVHSYNPASNKHYSAVIGDGKQTVTLIIPVDGQKDRFVISIKGDIAVISWDGKSPKTSEPEIIASLESKDNSVRINDGKADYKGRLWAGTMGIPDGHTFQPVGSLYSIDNANNTKKHLSNVTVSNGLVWSLDNKTFFFIDSFKYRVDSYDYDFDSGVISNEKTVFEFKSNDIPGIPDGMTIDSEGKLYVANFNGGQVLKIDPETGKLLTKIPIPSMQTTSVAFGGPNLDELYVTSADLHPETHQVAGGDKNPPRGCLFKVTNVGAKGLPMVNVKLN